MHEDDFVIEVDFSKAKAKGEESGGSTRLFTKQKKASRCKHLRVDIDDELRTVICSDCREELDAVQVLVEYANRERLMAYKHDTVSALNRKIDELKKEERKIKSSIRYVKKKLQQHVGSKKSKG